MATPTGVQRRWRGGSSSQRALQGISPQCSGTTLCVCVCVRVCVSACVCVRVCVCVPPMHAHPGPAHSVQRQVKHQRHPGCDHWALGQRSHCRQRSIPGSSRFVGSDTTSAGWSIQCACNVQKQEGPEHTATRNSHMLALGVPAAAGGCRQVHNGTHQHGAHEWPPGSKCSAARKRAAEHPCARFLWCACIEPNVLGLAQRGLQQTLCGACDRYWAQAAQLLVYSACKKDLSIRQQKASICLPWG